MSFVSQQRILDFLGAVAGYKVISKSLDIFQDCQKDHKSTAKSRQWGQETPPNDNHVFKGRIGTIWVYSALNIH